MERRTAEKGIVTRIRRNRDDWSGQPRKSTHLASTGACAHQVDFSSVTIRDYDDRCHHLIRPGRSCWQPGSRRPSIGTTTWGALKVLCQRPSLLAGQRGLAY